MSHFAIKKDIICSKGKQNDNSFYEIAVEAVVFKSTNNKVQASLAKYAVRDGVNFEVERKRFVKVTNRNVSMMKHCSIPNGWQLKLIHDHST